MASAIRTKADLFARLRQDHEALRRLGVQRLGLFGSFQHGTPHAESDVDLLVEFAPGAKSFDRYMALASLLEDRLGRPVELVTPESLSPHLGPHILRNVDYVTIGD